MLSLATLNFCTDLLYYSRKEEREGWGLGYPIPTKSYMKASGEDGGHPPPPRSAVPSLKGIYNHSACTSGLRAEKRYTRASMLLVYQVSLGRV